MRRRAVILASAASAAAILGGWQLGAVSTVTAPVAEGGASTAAAAGTGTGTTSSRSAAPATEAAAATDGTYVGATVSTRWGDVQVQVTISDGVIAEVTALQLTDDDGRSIQISNRAEPILHDEVLQAQSASVSMVSGATYTSAAYLQSLQSALDEAGF